MPSCNGVHQGSPGTFSPVQKPTCRRLASRHGNKLLAIITTRLAGRSSNLPGREPCSGRRQLESRQIPPCRRSGPGRGAFGSGRCHLVLPGGHLEPWQQMGWQQERGWGWTERLSGCGISWKEAAGESAPAAQPLCQTRVSPGAFSLLEMEQRRGQGWECCRTLLSPVPVPVLLQQPVGACSSCCGAGQCPGARRDLGVQHLQTNLGLMISVGPFQVNCSVL